MLLKKVIFILQQQIELNTKYKAAVVYGSLPPESRAEQARLFNEQEGGYKVMVATDAVGMGLNLRIGRIIFSTMQKFNGFETKEISDSQAKQIAGRAGRFGSEFPTGKVTCISKADMAIIRRKMNIAIPNLPKAGLLPSLDHLQDFAKSLPTDEPLDQLLIKFETVAAVTGHFFLCNLEQQIMIAKELNRINLSFKDRYQFLMAPISKRPEELNYLVSFASAHATGELVRCPEIQLIKGKLPRKLQFLEEKHRVVILYLWLTQRFPETFCDAQRAVILKEDLELTINDVLLGN